MRKKRRNILFLIIVCALLFQFFNHSEYLQQIPPSISQYMELIPGLSEGSPEASPDDSLSEDPETNQSESSQVILSGPPSPDRESSPSWYEALPPYSGEPWVTVNNGVPFFTEEEISTEAFEHYSELDSLGRCGPAFANVCPETMPTEPRGNIGMIHPSGWHTVKYDIIKDMYLYNRGHLIGFQLTGENANENNLFTCTRYLNVDGMLPWESQVAQYVQNTGNHVLYRVTPYFHGKNLVASGVLMEAYSVEDSGAGVCFNVYCYNVQPGIVIDYATGDSHEDAVFQAPGSDSNES